MLQLHDIRKSKVYQEAKEEGRAEGREEGMDRERRRSIMQLAARNIPPDEIADMLGLDIELVRNTMAQGE